MVFITLWKVVPQANFSWFEIGFVAASCNMIWGKFYLSVN